MAIIVILCGAPHLYKKDMNNSGQNMYNNVIFGKGMSYEEAYYEKTC